MDQGGINAPLMGFELATIGQVVAALANLAIANIGEKRKMAVYIRP